MNEFQSIYNQPIHFYLRLYREDGKLRLEALGEPITNPPRPYDYTMEFYGASNHKVLICIYYDGLETNFQVTERVQSKILSFFSNKWFFRA